MELATFPWGDLGAGGLVVFAVWLLLTGRIVPRSVLKDVEAQRDTYKQSWQEERAANAERDAHLDANTEVVRTMQSTMNAFLSLRRERS